MVLSNIFVQGEISITLLKAEPAIKKFLLNKT